MAPLENLQSRDLAWISDFVMQQMVIMLRPMMDHLQQTDAAVDYAQRVVQRLSMDTSELRGDIERTNKYLAILRQGLGVQNEGKCALQRSLEMTTRTAKRLDDQMEGVLGVMRGVEDSIGQLCSDARGNGSRQEDLAKQVAESNAAMEQFQAQVEKVCSDVHSVKDDLLNGEARLEVWQKELRELRRNQLGIVPKLEDKAGRPPPSQQSVRGTAAETWSQKKGFAAVDVSGAGACGPTGGCFSGGASFGDVNANNSGSSQQAKRMSRVGSAGGRVLQHLDRNLVQDHVEPPLAPRSSSRAAVWSGFDAEADDAGEPPISPSGESPVASRLPLLPKQTGTRAAGATADGPRLRFSATMSKPTSRGSPG